MKEERRMILQMIEDGKITVEEGVALLEALESVMAKEESSKNPEQDIQSHEVENPIDQVDQLDESMEEDLSFTESNQSYSENQGKHFRHEEHFSHSDSHSNFDDLKRDIKSTSERIRKEMVTQSKSMGTKLGELFDKLASKVKDIDFDFSLGNYVKIEKVLSGTFHENMDIEFTAENGKVSIEGWDRPEYRIEVKAAIRADNETEANAILNDILFFHVDESLLSLKVEPKRGTKISYIVFLPRHRLNHLQVVTSNGSIELDDLTAMSTHLTTSNGGIYTDEFAVDQLQCETSNGKIELKETDANDLSATTSNGSIRLEGEIKKAICRTSNGSIRYRLQHATEGSLNFETTNGSIEVRLPTVGLQVDGEIHTAFGSLECLLPETEITSVSKEISNRHLRFCSTHESLHPFHVNCKTTNGSIRIHPHEGEN